VPNKVTKKTGSAKNKQSTCLGGDENRKKTDSFNSQVELIATASARDLQKKGLMWMKQKGLQTVP